MNVGATARDAGPIYVESRIRASLDRCGTPRNSPIKPVAGCQPGRELLHLDEVRSSFFDDPHRFPSGPRRLTAAF